MNADNYTQDISKSQAGTLQKLVNSSIEQREKQISDFLEYLAKKIELENDHPLLILAMEEYKKTFKIYGR